MCLKFIYLLLSTDIVQFQGKPNARNRNAFLTSPIYTQIYLHRITSVSLHKINSNSRRKISYLKVIKKKTESAKNCFMKTNKLMDSPGLPIEVSIWHSLCCVWCLQVSCAVISLDLLIKYFATKKDQEGSKAPAKNFKVN